MCNMCFLPSTGISARIFAKWLEMPTLNEINDLIETGFVQPTTRRTISLHPMIQEITLSPYHLSLFLQLKLMGTHYLISKIQA